MALHWERCPVVLSTQQGHKWFMLLPPLWVTRKEQAGWLGGVHKERTERGRTWGLLQSAFSLSLGFAFSAVPSM